jgi:hypothetical protein
MHFAMIVFGAPNFHNGPFCLLKGDSLAHEFAGKRPIPTAKMP